MPNSIRFLLDENVPWEVGDYLESRAHEVLRVGDYFVKGTADPTLFAAAELEGLVVVTFDKDFKQLVKQVPSGHRRSFNKNAGRLSLNMREPRAITRLPEVIAIIEFQYEFAISNGKRFIAQVSETTISGVF